MRVIIMRLVIITCFGEKLVKVVKNITLLSRMQTEA